jgi:hypothetical protein
MSKWIESNGHTNTTLLGWKIKYCDGMYIQKGKGKPKAKTSNFYNCRRNWDRISDTTGVRGSRNLGGKNKKEE